MQITLTPEMLAAMGITSSDTIVLTLPLWKGGIMGPSRERQVAPHRERPEATVGVGG